MYFGPDSKMSKIFSQGDGAKTLEEDFYKKFNGTLSDGDSMDNYDYKFNPIRFLTTANSAEHVVGSWEDAIVIVVQDQVLFRVNNTMGAGSFFYGRYTDSWFGFSIGDKASDVNMMIEWTAPVRKKP